MTAALVTGAPGWLGTRLVRILAEGLPDLPEFSAGSDREIRVLALRGVDLSPLRAIGGPVRIVPGDVTDPATLAPFFDGAADATLFHAAGVIHPTLGVRQFYAVNEGGTRHVVDAAARAGVRRMVHVSSNSPFGVNRDARELFDEASPYRPYMNYGRSKKTAEDIVNEAGRAGAIETVIVRPPWFYGPDQPERQTRFFRMIQSGKMPLVGSGENRRSMAYVDNICQALLLAERVPHANGRSYWIADARPYTMNEILATIESVLEDDFSIPVAHRRRRLPSVVAEVAWALDAAVQGTGRYIPEIHVLSEMNKTIACRIDRARAELGYDPKVDLREGMRRSVQWMIEHGIALS